MMPPPADPEPTLYFDLGSPYAYLAVERAPSVLGAAPRLEPVLLGAIFAWRGWGSWSSGPQRAARRQQVQARAVRYGLAPLVWPPGWPADGLLAMRAATWAKRERRGHAFAVAVYRRQFVHGADIAQLSVLAACAAEVGLNPRAVGAAVRSQEVKHELHKATQAAWDAGVRGVPTLRVGGALFYGDDRLECAAARLGR